MAKVAIVGATGNVGTFAAHTIAEIPYVDEILLIGREGRENLLCGIAQDMKDAFAACGNYTGITYTTDIRELSGSEVVVCTAGSARQAGQDRLDLALGNARVVARTARNDSP